MSDVINKCKSVNNAVDVIRHFLNEYGAESGTSYWRSKIDGELLRTDWGYVEEGLEILQNYCHRLMKGSDDEDL